MIITFPGVGGEYRTQAYDAATGEALPSTKHAVAEYTAKVSAAVGSVDNGSRRSAVVEFGCCGATQDACDLNAGDIIQIVEDASVGTVTQFFKKLGMFVPKDGEVTSALQRGATKYGILNWTNGSAPGDPEPITPVKGGGGQVIIPFADLSSIVTDLPALEAHVSAGTLCRVAWESPGNSFRVFISKSRLGTTIKDFVGLESAKTTRADTGSGIRDGVLGKNPPANP